MQRKIQALTDLESKIKTEGVDVNRVFEGPTDRCKMVAYVVTVWGLFHDPKGHAERATSPRLNLGRGKQGEAIRADGMVPVRMDARDYSGATGLGEEGSSIGPLRERQTSQPQIPGLAVVWNPVSPTLTSTGAQQSCREARR